MLYFLLVNSLCTFVVITDIVPCYNMFAIIWSAILTIYIYIYVHCWNSLNLLIINSVSTSRKRLERKGRLETGQISSPQQPYTRTLMFMNRHFASSLTMHCKSCLQFHRFDTHLIQF